MSHILIFSVIFSVILRIIWLKGIDNRVIH